MLTKKARRVHWHPPANFSASQLNMDRWLPLSTDRVKDREVSPETSRLKFIKRNGKIKILIFVLSKEFEMGVKGGCHESNHR